MKISKIYDCVDSVIHYVKEDNTCRGIKLYKLYDCSLVGRNNYYPNILIYSNDQLIDPYNEKVMSLNKTSFYDEIYNFDINKIVKKIEDSVYFFIYNVDNYYHFIYDTLPYLHYYFALKLDCKILINISGDHKTNLYEFVSDTLKLLGVFDKIIFHEKSNIYSVMYVSSSLTFEGFPNNPPRPEIFRIYDMMASNLNTVKITPKKIYISRRTWIHNKLDNIGTNYTQRRKMVNENELVEKLNQIDFIEVFPELLSMSEKINMFKNAEFIVGSIGGGMCNLLFSGVTTKSVCIVSPTFLEINERFTFSMNHTNIKYCTNSKVFLEGNRKISNYVRARICDKTNKNFGQIGEIFDYDVNLDQYIVKISSEVTGWNSDGQYDEFKFYENQLDPLDNGLNSPYAVDIDEIINMVNFSI